MAKLFYLSTKRHGGSYYVQFRLEDGSLTHQKSTGTSNRLEAEKVAYKWLANGNIPARINSKTPDQAKTDLDKMNWMKQLKSMDFDYHDIQEIIDVLVQRQYLVSGILRQTPESRPVIPFLLEFWDYEKSPYRKEKRVRGKELSFSYFDTGLSRIKKYWVPRLEGKFLGEITVDDIEAIYQDPKLEGLAPKTVKGIIDVMVVAMNWAHQKKLTQVTGFDDVSKVTIKSKKRIILPVELIPQLFEAKWENEMSRLANLLAMYTGMRTGEIQALRIEDIKEDHIWIKHSWDDHVGIKCTKTEEERPAPISKELRQALLDMASFNPWISQEKEKAFVFFGAQPGHPVSQRGFNKYLRSALSEIGYANPEEISFYSWRHGYCTEACTVISNDKMIRMVSGHKTQQMFEHYSDHMDIRRTIDTMGNAAEQLFGDIVAKTLKSPVTEDALA